MSNIFRVVAAAVAAAVAALSLAACTPTVQPSPSATATVTPTMSEQERAEQAARTAVANWYAMTDELSSAAGQTMSIDDVTARVNSIAVGKGYTATLDLVMADRSAGYVQTGKVKVLSATVVSTDLTNTPTATPPVYPTVQLSVCVDVSAVDVVDKNGTSVVSPNRPNPAKVAFGVSNYDYPNGIWKVSFREVKGETC